MDQDFRVFLVGFGSNTAVDHHLAYWPQAENVPEKHLKSMEPQREAWLTFPSSFRRSCAVTGVPFVFLNFSLSAVDAWWATATYRIDGSGDYSHFWVGNKEQRSECLFWGTILWNNFIIVKEYKGRTFWCTWRKNLLFNWCNVLIVIKYRTRVIRVNSAQGIVEGNCIYSFYWRLDWWHSGQRQETFR